jgi:hypothetical protein
VFLLPGSAGVFVVVGWLGELFVEGAEQVPYGEGFGEIGGDSGGVELVDVVLGGVGAEHHDGDVAGGRFGAQQGE